ncbi:tetratricopeptide repeat protein [Streptomyces sp. NPDC020681]|uniref:tetratricopeptide repeat protein n=1 Tax=Streptomyces sp. NPDC020681 TaxID=3365083 RepID=UPI00379D560F
MEGTGVEVPDTQGAGAVGAEADALLAQANAAVADGELVLAIDRLGQAALLQPGRISPRRPVAWCIRGNLLADLGRFEDAVVSYRRSLEIEPDEALTLSNLANQLDKLDRLEEADATYEQAAASLHREPRRTSSRRCTWAGASICGCRDGTPKRWSEPTARWRSSPTTPSGG